MKRFIALLIVLAPAVAVAQTTFIPPGTFGWKGWRESVDSVASLPACTSGGTEVDRLRYVRPPDAAAGIYYCPSGGGWVAVGGAGGGGGVSIELDLDNDGTLESTAISRIAVTGDTNGIFGEPVADRLLIDAARAWPTCDVATAAVTATTATVAETGDSATAFFAAGTIEATRLPAVESLTTAGGAGTAPVSGGAGTLAMTNVATQAELDGHASSADIHVAHSTVTLTAGAGLSGGGDISASRSFATASQEAGFLADGGVVALTCGAGTEGKAQVLDSGGFEYCDGAATPVLRSGFLDADGADDTGVDTLDDLSDNQIGDLADVSEVGAGAGEALVSDGAGGWSPSSAAAILEGDSRLTDARAPTAHASTHQHGGADQVATATPGANAIPKAGAGGTLADGWLSAAVCLDSEVPGLEAQTAPDIAYTPAVGADWTDPDPVSAGEGLDGLAARVTDDEAALGTHSANVDAHHARDHAGTHALGGADPLTVTTLASGCTDVQVLGGTAAGTGVECQAAGGGIGGSTGATDNAILRADGTGGATLQSSGVTIDDANTLSATIVRGGAGSLATPAFAISNGGAGWMGLYMIGSNNLGIGIGAAATFAITQTMVTIEGRASLRQDQVNRAFAQTCNSNGGVGAGSLTGTVASISYIEVTNNDPDGCGVTLSETGAVEGQRLEVVVVSTAGGTADFADSSGVQETGTLGCSLALYGTVTFRYIGDRWVMTGCQAAN